jgi:hypothetical protein
MGHEPGQETILEPHLDEVVVFEEFFTAGLRMPPHPVLAEISNTDTSAHPQCHRLVVKIYLGSFKLRGCPVC